MPTDLNPSDPGDFSINETTVLRGIDANLNRAREALRVIEDACRFIFGDRGLARQCKSIRHELSTWTKAFQASDLILMRDATEDVGRHSEQESEYVREDVEHLLKANFSRAQQALRTIEEFSKTIDGRLGQAAEVIRYRIYETDRAVMVAYFSELRLADVRLYVLVDSNHDAKSFSQRIRLLVDAGVDAIQLRDKSVNTQTLLQRAGTLVQLTRGFKTLAIINDRVDLALACSADGVHLGQDDMPVAEARRLIGPRKLIGLSTHTIEQARQAEQLAVNYIGVGPTFPSNTKSFEEFTGVELLRQVAEEISLPAFAIGGIDEGNLAAVTGCGFHRVAVSGAIDNDLDRNSIQARVSLFKSTLSKASASASQKAERE